MKKRILVVDDDALFLAIITDLLEDDGYEILSFSSGMEALSSDLSGVQLVLTDVEMPDINGRRFLDILRNQRKVTVPLVFVTSSDAGELVADAIKLNVEFLPKPISPEALRAIVRRLCGPSSAPPASPV